MGRAVVPARKGGRNPKLDTQLERAKELAKQLKVSLDSGLRELGEAYPGLLQRAIMVAKSDDKEANLMLRFLLDYLPKLMPADPDEDTPLKKMLKDWQVQELHLHQHGKEETPTGEVIDVYA